MPQVRVNVTTLANAKAARKEKRNGRDVIVVPSATLPDNVIMNGILYPAEEIAKSYRQLNRTPAPLGHPVVNGKFVSASDPEGINSTYIGAWNENVRREGGRVLLDKVIDVQIANQSDGGKAVLAAIEAGGPIHTSTGLLAMLDVVNATTHKRVARNMVFDHDAILLGEAGAATPEQGVGMLVNADGTEEEVEVINSTITESADQEIDWAGTRLIEAVMRRQNAGAWEKMKAAILEALGFSEREPTTNKKDTEMPVTDEQFNALSAKVDTLSEGFNKIGDTIGTAVANAVKPLVDAHTEIVANQKAKDDAEMAELVNAVVKANLLDEETAKATPLGTLRKLGEKAKPAAAASLHNAYKGAGGDKPGFKLPSADKKEG